MKEHIPALASQSSHFIGQCHDLVSSFISKEDPEPDKDVQSVCAQLYIDCQLTSESALVLVQVGKEWDAEILIRAVLEGTVKFLYIFHGERSKIIRRVSEYLDILPDFGAIRRHDKASLFLSEVADPDSLTWKPFHDLLLPDQIIEQKRHGMNRTLRKKLEQDWSFTEMLKSFSDDDRLRKLRSHLLHGYGLSSHLIHKDGDGVGMVWERRQRSPQRQEAIATSHACRILSDVCSYAQLRTEQLLIFKGKNTSPIWELREKYSDLFSLLAKGNDQFVSTEYSDTEKA